MTRVALITGAAGGIGRGTARVFAEAGWHVVGTDRRTPEDDAGLGRFVRADLTDPDAVEALFEGLAAEEGRLDALVNNAAVQVCKPLAETTLEEWNAVMAANLTSVFLLTRGALPLLRAAGGAVVNVSSVHALATSTGIAAYAASKGALVAFTRAAALELGPEGVRVNAVLPGAVDTAMLHDGLRRGLVNGDTVAERLDGLARKHVMGRVGRPEEIGQAILFLADGARASFMTGQATVVDGGATARLSTE